MLLFGTFHCDAARFDGDGAEKYLSCTVKLCSMPVVFHYKSFRFFFYSNEGNPREAMHVHVRGPDGEAKFWLTPTVYVADSDGFDARTLRELRDAVVANKELIERTWNDYFA